MSPHIIPELGVHLNQRTQIIKEMLDQHPATSFNANKSSSPAIRQTQHSRVDRLMERFLETCPV